MSQEIDYSDKSHALLVQVCKMFIASSRKFTLRQYEENLVLGLAGISKKQIHHHVNRRNFLSSDQCSILKHAFFYWEGLQISSTSDRLMFRRPETSITSNMVLRSQCMQIAAKETGTTGAHDPTSEVLRNEWIATFYFDLSDIFGKYNIAEYMD